MPRLTAPAHLTAPDCPQKPYTNQVHGVTIEDPWFWLRDPQYPEVGDKEILDYLHAENSYFEQATAPFKPLQETVFEEIKGRIKEDDASVPWQDGLFDLKWAFTKGAQYRTWYVRDRSDDAFTGDGWAVLFDENEAAKDKDYFRLASLSISPNGKYKATAVDDNGSERFTIRVMDRDGNKPLLEAIPETSGEVIWDSNSKGFFYVCVSKEWRPYLVRYQSLSGGDPVDIYEEQDSQYFVHISRTSPRRHLIISAGTHITTEARLLPLDNPTAEPQLVSQRREGHQYSIDQGEAGFWILSNRDHKNFGLYLAPQDQITEPYWQARRMGDDRRYIHGMTAQKDRLVIDERVDGTDQIVLLDPQANEVKTLPFPEEARSVSAGQNAEYEQNFIRINYTSLITPQSVWDYDSTNDQIIIRKEQEIPSGYDKSAYQAERFMVTARDGTNIPVSLVYKKGWERKGASALHLYGYGAYGLGMDASFAPTRLSLLDRGTAFAIAHIRGGDELGYGWYEAGKLERRTNTFNDFVDVARSLIDEGRTRPDKLTISGGSAGGELMGAAVNQAPELFAGVVLHVPFVDVLNTMLDKDLPLTPMEWPEWGNPIESEQAFNTIQNYCPYSNIEEKNYPPMMVTGGLNDPRVTYWEPAKWTAKLRATKSDDNLLIMKINMGAGHGGKSGRYERYHEVAEEYAFILNANGEARS